MKVVFRVDASQHIGSGHVMRCLVLAEALRFDGHTVLFATREQTSDLNTFINNKGFDLIHLMQPASWQIPKTTADYEAWLQVSEEQDYQDFVSKVVNVDLVIVDHYGINADWHNKVKQTLKCKLMVIDDLVRLHNADIVLDQTLNRCQKEYTDLHPCLALTGTDFALLKPDFAYVRESLLKKQSPQKHTILISMGGIDQPNASLNVLNALKNEAQKLPITVLLSKRSPNYEQVKSFALANSGWVEHIEFVEDMPALMGKHTIMIGAPGSTSWERACLGIPSIIVPIADNQNTIAQELAAVKAVKVVKLNNITTELIIALEEVIAQWESYSRNNFALCDGLGCKRTIQQLNRFMKTC
ncbi:UDP-2,4-diacetamido-2,4,6-trideoxy-beta-L-altropyranose hydrolase [Pseudoalteromonas tetraodonis]|uniref:UDP-2,4-diacetamido-2,4, 6-trideoxy-beta-L-altropyranose hydrolase n=1 Tax=Pseudoalteromonas tetraodonis TaxID=43659 RepID=UPI003CFFAEFF